MPKPLKKVTHVTETVQPSGEIIKGEPHTHLVADSSAATSMMHYGALVLLYALYYGIINHDLAELCSHKMASSLGLSGATSKLIRKESKEGDDEDSVELPNKSIDPNICPICNDPLVQKSDQRLSRTLKNENKYEKRHKLSCG
eukprot:CAMPEP_0174268310 /NCGR_PEP_ID=MMETSP0439-20130205/36970_1 /TAXON_ID=0 /ORGANISM="Stereomyxa ramosa, Strain Chinc5" /LENGTH=142 /DNA_ID=CAMNT_0015356399 /DNA_START=313 /DNA_END=737 /DNA_ORIENTATION=+